MFSWLGESAEKLLQSESIDSMLKVYQRDISEFAQQVTETARPLAALLPQIPSMEDELEISTTTTDRSQHGTDASQQRLHRLQSHMSTFTTPITDDEDSLSRQLGAQSFEQYWRILGEDASSSSSSSSSTTTTTDDDDDDDDVTAAAAAVALRGDRKLLEEKTEEITRQLEQYTPLRERFEQLVPTEVSYEDFWKRYLFRYELYLRDEERRRTVKKLTSELKEDHFDSWDDDEDVDDTGDGQPGNDETKKEVTATGHIEAQQWYERFKSIQLDDVVVDDSGQKKQMLVREIIEYYEGKLREKDRLIEQLRRQFGDGAVKEEEQLDAAAHASEDKSSSSSSSSSSSGKDWEVLDDPSDSDEASCDVSNEKSDLQESAETDVAAGNEKEDSVAKENVAKGDEDGDYDDWD